MSHLPAKPIRPRAYKKGGLVAEVAPFHTAFDSDGVKRAFIPKNPMMPSPIAPSVLKSAPKRKQKGKKK